MSRIRNDAVLVEKQKIELEARLKDAQRQIQQVRRNILKGDPGTDARFFVSSTVIVLMAMAVMMAVRSCNPSCRRNSPKSRTC